MCRTGRKEKKRSRQESGPGHLGWEPIKKIHFKYTLGNADVQPW